MKTLKRQLETLADLRRKRDSLAYQFYNHENQIILINMIIDEIKDIKVHLPEDLYLSLMPPAKLAGKDIKNLSSLLKKIIIFKCQNDTFNSPN